MPGMSVIAYYRRDAQRDPARLAASIFVMGPPAATPPRAQAEEKSPGGAREEGDLRPDRRGSRGRHAAPHLLGRHRGDHRVGRPCGRASRVDLSRSEGRRGSRESGARP